MWCAESHNRSGAPRKPGSTLTDSFAILLPPPFLAPLHSLVAARTTLLPLAKLLLQRPACTQTGAIGLVNKECHSSPQCCAANES